MAADDFIHQWLGDHWFVLLVVAQRAKTNHIDNHVLMERHPEIKRDFSHHDDSFRIVAVDMKDRRLNHFRHVGAIKRRARVAWIRSGETDLIVDDDMHGAAGSITARLRQVQGFHHYTLGRKCGVAMQQHG